LRCDQAKAATRRRTPDKKKRFELGLALGRLDDPRIATDLREPAAYAEIPAGTYRIEDNRKKDYEPWTPLVVGGRLALEGIGAHPRARAVA